MMLLELICAPCIMEKAKDGIEAADGSIIPTPISTVNETGIYEVTCHKGHKSKVVIDNLNFEILFDYAINALADSYFREAVLSFTAAMERYFEFFIKVICRKNGTDFNQIDSAWKLLSNQSERQLGAYIMFYVQEFNELPPLLNPNNETQLRNKVIHKGYILTKEEALQFGEAVLNVIEQSLIKLKTKHYNFIEECFSNYSYKNGSDNKVDSCVNIMTTIDVMHGREINKGDGRTGNIALQIDRVLRHRVPKKMTLLKDRPQLD